MSAKTIAQEYFKRICFISSIEFRDGCFYITSLKGESLALHETSIQVVRHHLTNYSEVCRLLIDTEKQNHSDVFLNNIISKFRELVNNLIFQKSLSLIVRFYNDNFLDRLPPGREDNSL